MEKKKGFRGARKFGYVLGRSSKLLRLGRQQISSQKEGAFLDMPTHIADEFIDRG